MNVNLFSLFALRRRKVQARRTSPQSYFRPVLEGLEQREVMSAPATLAAPALAPALVGQAQTGSVAQQLFQALNIKITKITNVGFQNGQLQLVANGTWLNGQSFPLPLNLNLTADPPVNGACPILHLDLGPLNLNVLGLNVNLDNCKGGNVTVDITAQHGALLGDLLCDVGNLLNSGTPLGALTTPQLGALTTVLNDVLGGSGLGRPSALAGATLGGMGNGQAGPQGNGHSCPILNVDLEQGLHLNLLGLAVDTSPICLDVTAQRGPGNLLGNLLCSVSHLLDNQNLLGNANLIGQILNRLDNVLGRI